MGLVLKSTLLVTPLHLDVISIGSYRGQEAKGPGS
jgi:hypothetical protein